MTSSLEPKSIHPTPQLTTKRFSIRTRISIIIAGLALLYFVAAYFVAPDSWKWWLRRHPTLADIPNITHTGSGIPGDPLNVALIGTENELKRLMLDGRWFPADPLTLRSCLEIAADTVLRRNYDDAPVSNLYLMGRKEDLAFEQPVGPDPKQRHHVRFWRTDRLDSDGRPVWIGAATFDTRVGLSRTTGEITHHIAPDVDAERDHLLRGLDETGKLTETYRIEDFHRQRNGRNGGGDPWFTDGDLLVGVIDAS